MAESNYSKFKREKRDALQNKRRATAKRVAADKIINGLVDDGKKQKGADSPWYKLQQRQQDFREKKYADQKKKELDKDKGQETKNKAKAVLANVGQGQRISSTEGGATAAQKAVGNAANDAGRLVKAAALGIKGALETRKGKKDAESRPDKKSPGQGGRPAKLKAPTPPKPAMKQIGGTQTKGLLSPEGRQSATRRQLPPASSPNPTKKPTIGQPAAGSRPMLPGSMKKKMVSGTTSSGQTRIAPGTIGTSTVGKPAAERPALKPSPDKRRMLPPSTEGTGVRTVSGKSSLGSQARANPALKAKLTNQRGGSTDFKKAKRKILGLEEFTYKEQLIIEKVEFLQEVEDKEEKKKKRKDVIDIMKGKNKVIINPIGESIDKSKMKCNKPKAQAVGNSLTGKSHVVKACSNGQEKIIRFGQRGVKGSPDGAKRNKAFKARHAKNISKGKMSAAYWANRVKW